MFELGELYAAWTENPAAFWAQDDYDSLLIQDRLVLEPDNILDEDTWAQTLQYACPPPKENEDDARAWLAVVVNGLKLWSQRAAGAVGSAAAGNGAGSAASAAGEAASAGAGTAAPPAALAACREALEKYLFLTRLHLARLDESLAEIEPTPKTRKVNLGAAGDQARSLLDAISRTIQTGVSAVFPATESAKRASLALLYLEPSCRLLQHEAVVREPGLVRELVRLLSLAVKLQHQQAMVRTQILQLLTYYEHAVPVTVQLLDTLQRQFDHTALGEFVLRDLAAEAAAWSDSQNSATINRAKCVNLFLQLLTQSMPALVASNLPSVSILIGSPVPQLRQAVLDIAVPVIQSILAPAAADAARRAPPANGAVDPSVPTSSLSTLDLGGASQAAGTGSGNGSEPHAGVGESGVGIEGGGGDADAAQFKPAFDLVQLVEARVNDLSHFCRLRAVQVLASVAREPLFIGRRDRFTQIAIAKMKDRTQLVRRQAMRLMKQLIDSHPQVMHPNCLSRQVWQASLAQIEAQVDELDLGETRQQLEAAQAFVAFTLKFIQGVDEAVAVTQTLLLSRSKSDILDAVDLLVYADAYSVESSAAGIRAVVHLVWAKADNDEANLVCKTAVATYRDLFMTAPPDLDVRRGAQLIADNLITLTRGATQGELTSLERLLCLAMEEDWVSVAVVSRLWGVYQTQLDIEPAQRRGAAIILSMLALADRSVACSGIGVVVDIGLSSLGVKDPELAAYSFAILKRSIVADADAQRLPPSYELFDRVVAFLLLPSRPELAMQWTSLAKEALAAISAMCDCSPRVYTRLINAYVAQVFGDEMHRFSTEQRMQLFAQLLYIVGEVALNLLVYLERSELEFKRKLQASENTAPNQDARSSTGGGQDAADNPAREEELMAGGGSREDDFQDVLRDIKEEGILYSDRALLKPFLGTVTEICRMELARSAAQAAQAAPPAPPVLLEDDEFAAAAAASVAESGDSKLGLLMEQDLQQQQQQQNLDQQQEQERAAGLFDADAAAPVFQFQPDAARGPLLVIAATQTLSKFMCVSSRFCEESLPLLVDLMSRHTSNVVRSNFVVALSDVAICFNRLIDDHTEYLYDRLNDKDPVVQRTCIVALTFLILAGQIKVKGKLGEMAKAVANPNRKISSLATMFFRELATKENAIYNSFLDMLSTLIADSALPEADMLRILKFLAEFVDRERQMKQLTEKLVARLGRCESQRQWSAYVQVLKHLPRKLDDALKERIAQGFSRMPGEAGGTSMTDQELNEAEEDEERNAAEARFDAADPMDVSQAPEVLAS